MQLNEYTVFLGSVKKNVNTETQYVVDKFVWETLRLNRFS